MVGLEIGLREQLVERLRTVSLAQIARDTGINRPSLTRFRSGKGSLSKVNLDRLQSYLGLDLKLVPLSEVASGTIRARRARRASLVPRYTTAEKLAKLAQVATRAPSDGTREWFAEILGRHGCTEITSFEVRAGDNYIWAPSDGLSDEDYDAFAPVLEGDEREELRRMIESSKKSRREWAERTRA